MNNLEWEKSLPKKRMAVGVLIFNSQEEILLVKRVDKKEKYSWTFVGGVIEKNESPKQALLREIKEEIKININKLDFVCVQYTPQSNEKTESLQFIFNAGKLTNQQIKRIKLNPKEHSEYKFYTINQAAKLLSKNAAKRLIVSINALRNNCAIYLE